MYQASELKKKGIYMKKQDYQFQLLHGGKTLCSTSLLGRITCSYKHLAHAFGEPQMADEYKVSGEWTFFDFETETTIKVYDWKQTCLYEIDLPSVKDFRESGDEVSFSIAVSKTVGSEFLDAFKGWLQLHMYFGEEPSESKPVKIVRFFERRQYGKMYIYVKDEADQISISALTGRKTVTQKDLDSLKELGVQVEVERL